MVRAKVTCLSLDGNTAHFHTVYEPPDERDTENQRFTQATPWGSINLGIDNPAALEQFAVGGEYYVDFSPVTPPPVEAEPPAPTERQKKSNKK